MAKSKKEAMESLMSPKTSGAECVQRIQKAFTNAKGALSARTQDGDTILHAAAKGKKSEALVRIMAFYPGLVSVRNDKGYTALEEIQECLDKSRMKYEGVFELFGRPPIVKYDEFEGFDQNDLACLAALTGTRVVDVSKLSADEIAGVWVTSHKENTAPDPDAKAIRDTLRRKYGCTCGRCVGGFLGPRMLFATSFAADKVSSQMVMDTTNHWSFFSDGASRHLPENVRLGLFTDYKMKRGLCHLYEHIAKCLKAGRIPTDGCFLALVFSVSTGRKVHPISTSAASISALPPCGATQIAQSLSAPRGPSRKPARRNTASSRP
ncbi:hypothetical protein IMZ48_05270 [Candidatus Bathyarchaeota archaeon]|nr:hypothetical protein [Candidatus Bathyarchaeota archaeon]